MLNIHNEGNNNGFEEVAMAPEPLKNP